MEVNLNNLTDVTRFESFSTLDPIDLGYNTTVMESVGLDVWDFIDIENL